MRDDNSAPLAALPEPDVPNTRLPLDRAWKEGSYSAKLMHEHAAKVTADLRAENAKLRTVMIAAAEEISEHWEAHCDAEGYGPVNLQRRLEEGIPSEYGYTAGAFAKLRERVAALEADAARYRWIREVRNDWSPMFNQTPDQFKQAWAKLETGKCGVTLDAAIDTAIAAHGQGEQS